MSEKGKKRVKEQTHRRKNGENGKGGKRGKRKRGERDQGKRNGHCICSVYCLAVREHGEEVATSGVAIAAATLATTIVGPSIDRTAEVMNATR